MISSLSGLVSSVSLDSVVVTVGGFGLKVLVTQKTALGLKVGDHVTLNTSLQVREDSLTLFGFAEDGELALFEQLIGVSGVGPKSALSVVGTLTPTEIVNAVQTQDDAAFKKVSGIGPKTAKLIVIALAGRVSMAETASATSQHVSLVNAVTSLGFSSTQVLAAIQKLELSELSFGDAVKSVLAALAKS